MLNRPKIELMRRYDRGSQGCEQPKIKVSLPRLWMVLSVLVLPFIMLSARFFESLERSGTAGALIADTMLPASIVGYFILLFVLKQRRI